MRRAAATLALAALALGAAGAARATPEDDVRTVAVAFLEATARQDGPALCGTMTAELQARVGGGRSCLAALEAERRAQLAVHDQRARGRLTTAHVLATVNLPRRQGAPPRFLAPARMAALIQKHYAGVRVVTGRGPGAAKGRRSTWLVVDAARSSATRLVLYAESDAGTIFRLVGGVSGRPSVTAAAQGLPEPEPPIDWQVDGLELGGGGSAFVWGSLGVGEQRTAVLLRLAVEGGAWRVADLFVSGLPVATPPLRPA